MRVLIVNTSERTGGAAVAAHRLMDALNNHGVKAKMLVRDCSTQCLTVSTLPASWKHRWHFLWERIIIWIHLHFRREHLFEIDIANCGTDITRLPEFKEADVIHLHWINQGMLSLKVIRKILESGKPVVWTMHDMWPATAICHYARGCRHYTTYCRACPLLPEKGDVDDFSTTVWNRKVRTLAEGHVFFVTCSRWLGGEAKKSALLRGQSITTIPNTINTHVYAPMDKTEARKKVGLPLEGRIILFVSQRVTDERKGMSHFVEAIETLLRHRSVLRENTSVAILGGHASEVASQLPLSVLPLGYVADEDKIVSVYNSADVFVTPSLEDNLPNTIMEAMACGVPCVGFRVGGIPEMIDHKKNGYVADFRNADDLAEGIGWVLCEADYESLSCNAVCKVVHDYSQASVSLRYTEIYQQALAQKLHKL